LFGVVWYVTRRSATRRATRRGEASGEENEEATLTVIMKKKRGGGISFRRGWKGKIKREAAMFFIRRNRLKTKKIIFYLFC